MTTTQFSFRSGFNGLRDHVAATPEAAVATFSAASRQVEGLWSKVAVRDFALDVDEPQALGGTDKGPNPVELVLAALASCQEITYRLYADRLGVPLDGVSVTVEGDIDLRGFTGADDSVRPGFRDIRIKVDLTSSAPLEALERVKATVDKHCPVLDIIGNAVPTAITFTSAEAHIPAAE